MRHHPQPVPGKPAADRSCSVPDQTPPPAMGDPESTSAMPESAVASSAAAELQQLLLATDDITGFLDQLATLTVKVLPGEVSCGITLRRDHGALTVASSDSRASQVDEI